MRLAEPAKVADKDWPPLALGAQGTVRLQLRRGGPGKPSQLLAELGPLLLSEPTLPTGAAELPPCDVRPPAGAFALPPSKPQLPTGAVRLPLRTPRLLGLPTGAAPLPPREPMLPTGAPALPLGDPMLPTGVAPLPPSEPKPPSRGTMVPVSIIRLLPAAALSSWFAGEVLPRSSVRTTPSGSDAANGGPGERRAAAATTEPPPTPGTVESCSSAADNAASVAAAIAGGPSGGVIGTAGNVNGVGGTMDASGDEPRPTFGDALGEAVGAVSEPEGEPEMAGAITAPKAGAERRCSSEEALASCSRPKARASSNAFRRDVTSCRCLSSSSASLDSKASTLSYRSSATRARTCSSPVMVHVSEPAADVAPSGSKDALSKESAKVKMVPSMPPNSGTPDDPCVDEHAGGAAESVWALPLVVLAPWNFMPVMSIAASMSASFAARSSLVGGRPLVTAWGFAASASSALPKLFSRGGQTEGMASGICSFWSLNSTPVVCRESKEVILSGPLTSVITRLMTMEASDAN
mmetsp:Transcript_74901/g.129818  ORF Transcript_74901/g.129818 Transcript_74901/m.129818 type:complete len:522 (+) Transcript_74901:489-2054(+)